MEVHGMRTDRIRIKVSLAVQLIDDYTDKIIPANMATVLIPGEKNPFVKNGGYYVFTNIAQKNMVVEVSAFQYQKKIVEWVRGELNAVPVLRLRMVPNERYGLPADTTYVRGKLKAGESLNLVCPENESPLRLWDDYGKESFREIKIYNPTARPLEDRGIVLMSGDRVESAQVTVEKEKNLYELYENLKGSYKKAETEIFLPHHIEGDINGEFLVPLSGIHKTDGEIICQNIKDGKVKKKYKLKYGVVNNI